MQVVKLVCVRPSAAGHNRQQSAKSGRSAAAILRGTRELRALYPSFLSTIRGAIGICQKRLSGVNNKKRQH
jgi:hypothetical protein